MFNRREDWEAANRDKLKVSNPFVNNDSIKLKAINPLKNNDSSNNVNLIHLRRIMNDDNHRFTFFISVPMNDRDDEEVKKDISDAEKYYSGLMDKIRMKYEFKNNFNSTYNENDITKLYESKYSRKEDLDRVVRIARLGEAITKMATCDAVIFIDIWEKAKGCYIEHKVADKYNLKIFHFYTNNDANNVDIVRNTAYWKWS